MTKPATLGELRHTEWASPARIHQATMAEAVQHGHGEPLDAVIIVRNNLLERFDRQFGVPPRPEWTAGTTTIFRVESVQKALRGVT